MNDDIPAGITVFMPSAGKFLEFGWGGGIGRTNLPALYFDGPSCTGNVFTDRLNEPPPSGIHVVMGNVYYLYEFKDENQIHSFYTMDRNIEVSPKQIMSRQERGQLCEDSFTYPSGYSVDFQHLSEYNTGLYFPFQAPLRFE
jgi:hypothetical protein